MRARVSPSTEVVSRVSAVILHTRASSRRRSVARTRSSKLPSTICSSLAAMSASHPRTSVTSFASTRTLTAVLIWCVHSACVRSLPLPASPSARSPGPRSPCDRSPGAQTAAVHAEPTTVLYFPATQSRRQSCTSPPRTHARPRFVPCAQHVPEIRSPF